MSNIMKEIVTIYILDEDDLVYDNIRFIFKFTIEKALKCECQTMKLIGYNNRTIQVNGTGII